MVKIQNKSTKRIRIAQIVFFILEIFLTSTPFIWDGDANNTMTVLDMITNISLDTGSEINNGIFTKLGLLFILFILIPVIALGFQLFDRNYNLKNIVGLICSFAGVALITFGIGSNLCIGSMISLLLYLLTFFMSVMGIFARYLNQKNIAD